MKCFILFEDCLYFFCRALARARAVFSAVCRCSKVGSRLKELYEIMNERSMYYVNNYEIFSIQGDSVDVSSIFDGVLCFISFLLKPGNSLSVV